MNLTARITGAEREGLRREPEGLKVSLAAADAKLAQLDVLTVRRASATRLALPAWMIPGHLLPYVCPTGSRLDNEGVRIRAAHPEPNR